MMRVGKKGSSLDNIYAAISFFGLAIFFLTVMLFWNSAKGLNDDLWDQSSIGQDIKASGQKAVDNFDWILLMAYFGIHLGVLVLAYLLRTHPVVYIAALILTVVLAALAAPLSNAYEEIRNDEQISVVSGDLPMTNNIMDNLPKYEVIWGFITIVMLFGFARYEGFV